MKNTGTYLIRFTANEFAFKVPQISETRAKGLSGKTQSLCLTQ